MNRYNLFDEQSETVFGEASYENYCKKFRFQNNNETDVMNDKKEYREVANINNVDNNILGDGCVDQCAKLELARAYVRIQDFTKYYEPMESLTKGTAFPDLYKTHTRKMMGRGY